MEKSNLVPFLRHDLDILFIGLNPAKGSSDNGHYFSVNQAFWNQLYAAGLITKEVDKLVADNEIFANTSFNFKNWQYGITDIVTKFAESDSSKIKLTANDCSKLINDIKKFQPKTAILLHSKVLSKICEYLNINTPISNTGELGQLIENCQTIFYNIAFPHGNSISSDDKVIRYKELKKKLLSLNYGSGRTIVKPQATKTTVNKKNNTNKTPAKKTTDLPTETIEKIIKTIDDELMETGKDYLTLAQANKLLLSEDIITLEERHNETLKQLLEQKKIPHAYWEINQWKIPLSEEREQERTQRRKEAKEKLLANTNNKEEKQTSRMKVFFYIAFTLFCFDVFTEFDCTFLWAIFVLVIIVYYVVSKLNKISQTRVSYYYPTNLPEQDYVNYNSKTPEKRTPVRNTQTSKTEDNKEDVIYGAAYDAAGDGIRDEVRDYLDEEGIDRDY